MAVPDTPVGRQLSWLLASLNGGEVLPTSSVSDHFAPAVLQHQQPAGIVRTLEMASHALAPVTLAGFEGTPTENEIVAVVRGRDTAMHRVTLATDPYSGHRIGDWSIRPLEPVKPEEIGVRAVGRLRGCSFARDRHGAGRRDDRGVVRPGCTCRTDFAGYCRLTLPDGAGPAAVKVMNALLWGRMDTYNFLPEGALGSDRTVFEVLAAEFRGVLRTTSGDRAGLDQGPPRRAPGVCRCRDGALPRLGWLWRRSSWCHPSTRIFYTKDPIAPDPSRSHTSPRVSAWWAFNLDPGQ